MSEPILELSESLSSAMDAMNESGRPFCLVTEENHIVGIISDGDLRRYLRGGGSVSDAAEKAMVRDFHSLRPEAEPEEIQQALRDYTFVPVLDARSSLVYVATRDRPHRIPLAEPSIDQSEETKLLECFRSGWISSRSPFVKEFEVSFSTYIGAREGLCVSNGTVAIEMALRALGIGANDEVIVPDLTFGATANAVLNVGASPQFIDITDDDWGIDPEHLDNCFSPRTKAVIVVHLYGAPARIEEIRQWCDDRNVLLIEDCAEAIGTRIGGEHVGTVGDAGTFSFFANKTITTGEGGYVTFRDDRHTDAAKLIRDHGLAPRSGEHYWHEVQGGNMRMTGLQAALGIAQLEKVDDIVETKRRLAQRFTEYLPANSPITIRGDFPSAINSHWLVVGVMSDELSDRRVELLQHLGMLGVETRLGFQPLHRMPAFAPYVSRELAFVNSSAISKKILCLPSGAKVSSSQVRSVVNAITEFVDAWRAE